MHHQNLRHLVHRQNSPMKSPFNNHSKIPIDRNKGREGWFVGFIGTVNNTFRENNSVIFALDFTFIDVCKPFESVSSVSTLTRVEDTGTVYMKLYSTCIGFVNFNWFDKLIRESTNHYIYIQKKMEMRHHRKWLTTS